VARRRAEVTGVCELVDHSCGAHVGRGGVVVRAVVDGPHDGFELIDIGQEALAADGRDAHDRHRPSVAAQPLEAHDTDFGERVQMPIEVAVGQPAGVNEIGEPHPAGVRDEARAHGEPAALVKDALEPGVGEGSVAIQFPCSVQARSSRSTSAPMTS
jgi:hypothetical protein